MEHSEEDPRIIRTRNLIIDAFLDLIKEKDFNTISVKDITERATINRATFYRHFTDKYILLEKILNQMMKNIGIEQIQERTELDEETFKILVNAFSKLVEELKQTFGRNYHTVIIVMESEIKDKLIDIISTFIQLENIEQRKIIATMFVTSIYSATCSWISKNKIISYKTFLSTILPFLMGAVSQLSVNDNNLDEKNDSFPNTDDSR